jgi:uncharacterized protein YndB with AHSA1/START domain
VNHQPKLGRGRDRPLTAVERQVAAPPSQVFGVLTDAWLYPVWVVGATHIRDVDDNWPTRGSKIHHQVGAWPFTLSDTTAVVELEPDRRLVLQGRAFPFGEVYIEITVEPDGPNGSVVRMAEAPSYGPARLIDNPLQRWLLAARNRESLARLKAVAENRHQVSVTSR